MTYRARNFIGATALIVAAPAAQAQVTAAELWAEWQAQADATAQPMTAATMTETADGLTLGGVTSRYVDSDITVETSVDEITMTETGDGTIDIAVSNPYRINLTFPVDGATDEARVEILTTHENLSITASGPVGARSYAYTADALTMTEGAVDTGGQPVEVSLLGEVMALNADYTIDGRDLNNLQISSATQIESLGIGLDFGPMDRSQGYLKSSFQIAGFASTGQAALGAIGALAAADDLPDGFAVDALLEYDALGFVFDFQQPGESFMIANATDGGSLSATVSEAAFGYGVTASGSRWNVAGSDIPVPVDVRIGQSEFRFELPVSEDPVPQPFAARIAYEDVTLDDTIWAMMDPTQAVPRDPISLIADVSGLVRVLVDMMDTDPSNFDAPPGELRSVDINDLRISAAGAELTGSGALTFEDGQMVPMPVGRIDLALSGGMGLLDRLQASGVVPTEQLFGIRAALGAFARPGPSPDTLESTVEFGPGGSISANGMPLQ